MSWFNETHEGDNPESNTEKNTDNVEANSEEVDKKRRGRRKIFLLG